MTGAKISRIRPGSRPQQILQPMAFAPSAKWRYERWYGGGRMNWENPEFSADSAIRKPSWAKPMPPALSIVIKFFVGAKVARVGSLCRNPHLEHRPAALPVRGSHGAAV